MIAGMALEKLQKLTEPKQQLAADWQAFGAARGPQGPARPRNFA